jgi:hypothetical protein
MVGLSLCSVLDNPKAAAASLGAPRHCVEHQPLDGTSQRSGLGKAGRGVGLPDPGEVGPWSMLSESADAGGEPMDGSPTPGH